jgi:hypothetical protein
VALGGEHFGHAEGRRASRPDCRCPRPRARARSAARRSRRAGRRSRDAPSARKG